MGIKKKKEKKNQSGTWSISLPVVPETPGGKLTWSGKFFSHGTFYTFCIIVH